MGAIASGGVRVLNATPEPFLSVGRFYQDFEQTGDEEVKELLERATAREPVAQARGGSR